jgi:hypothetical protein
VERTYSLKKEVLLAIIGRSSGDSFRRFSAPEMLLEEFPCPLHSLRVHIRSIVGRVIPDAGKVKIFGDPADSPGPRTALGSPS